MRLLVTGSRNWCDHNLIRSALEEWKAKGATVLIHGDARGADAIAAQIAADLGLQILSYPAQWAKYGKKAGTLRNEQMLREGRPGVVIAFPLPDSIGTWHMVSIAKRAGIKTVIYDKLQLDALDADLDRRLEE